MSEELDRSPEYVLFMISLVATMAIGIYHATGQLFLVMGVTTGSTLYWATTAPDLSIDLKERLMLRD